jgi:hypothetical protein
MIQRPTTLILGAGASKPFGFPIGYELLSRVIEYGFQLRQNRLEYKDLDVLQFLRELGVLHGN